MKLVINQGVRDTIAQIESACDEYDALCQSLANPHLSPSAAVDAGQRRETARYKLVSLACKVLSHASRGRRYPNMTCYRKGE